MVVDPGVTVAAKVTGCAYTEGFADEVIVVIVEIKVGTATAI